MKLKPRTYSTAKMDRSAWLMLRQGGIGGSDAGAVLGLNKYKTPTDVWKSKVEGEAEFTSPLLELGSYLEKFVADRYTKETGRKVRKFNKMIFSAKEKMLFANVDRLFEDNGKKGILEIKTVSPRAYATWGEGVPLSYYAQLQHYLYVMDFEFGEFAVLNRENGELMEPLRVQRDDAYLREHVEQLKEFWEKYVLTKTAPPPQVKELNLLPSLPTSIEATAQIIGIARQRVDTAQQLSNLKEDLEELDNKLKLFMAQNEILECNGQHLFTWKSRKEQMRFDTKRFELEHEGLFKQYLSASAPSRQFLQKKENLFNS